MMENSGKKVLQWNRETTCQLIDFWKQHLCLYDSKHKMYHNKCARYNALTQIAEAMDPYFGDINQEDVKVKINNLRTQYHHELKKQRDRGKCSRGIDDFYQPCTYWFGKLSFLKKFLGSRKHRNHIEKETPEDLSIVTQTSDDAVRDLTPLMVQQSNVSKYPADIEAFGEHVKAEMMKIQSDELRDEAMLVLSNIIFKMKKKQRNMDLI